MKYINEIYTESIFKGILNAWIICQLHASWYIWILYFFTIVGVKFTKKENT